MVGVLAILAVGAVFAIARWLAWDWIGMPDGVGEPTDDDKSPDLIADDCLLW
jgi:hypothetical protein